MADQATEQTLQDLLQQAQQMNATLIKISNILGKGSTAAPGAGAASAAAAANSMQTLSAGMSRLAPAAGMVGTAFNVLGVAINGVVKIFGMLGGLVSGLFDKIGKVASILGDFALTAAAGNMKLSDMVSVMGDLAEQIPIVGGLFAALISPMKLVIQRQEETLEMFRKISAVGAGVGESLETLRLNARSTGLTMDEYSKVVSENGQVFATMGGDVQSGLKLFTKNMQAVMGPGSEVSRAFFGMGYTAEEAAGALANYMRSQGSMNKQGLQDSKASAQAALELAQQTQLLSETTGKRRQQVQEELEAAQKEQNWQAYLAGLSEKEAKEATAKLSYALQVGGKDAGDMLKTKLMTGVTLPLTESAKKQDAITGGALSGLVDGIGNARGSMTEQQQQMAQANAQFVRKYDQSVKDFGNVSALQVAQGKQGLLDATAIANRNRQMQDGKMKTEDQIVREEMAKLEKIKAAGGSDAAALAQQTQNLREFGNIIDRIIGTLAGPLLGPILKLTESFQGVATTLAKELEPYFKTFGEWLGKWVNKFTDIKSWEEFKAVMFAFWEDIKAKAGPMIKDVWESVKPVMLEAIKNLFDFLWEGIKSSVLPRWARSDTESEKAEDAAKERKKKEEDLARLTENIRKVEEAKAKLGDSWLDNQRRSAMESNIKRMKSRQESLQSELGASPTSSKPAAPQQAASSGAAPAASNNAQLIRDWAYSIMTGQAKDAPASIAKQVDEVVKNPDATLKKSVDDYNAAIKRKAEEEKARKDREAEAAKAAASKPAESAKPAETAVAAPAAAPETNKDSAALLNSMVAQLVRINTETAEATKKTANLIASNGNLFRR